ncbi:MAG: type II toxin-antitoxin system RelE/ParE family toxin [Hyphomicrobiales bacterium]
MRYSKLALAELDVILNTIAAEDPGAAARFEGRVRRVVERIGRFPEGARKVDGRPGVFRVPLVRYPYVIYYSVIQGEVTILRLLHGARDRA